MDIQKLRTEHPKLLNYLTEKGYSVVYIERIRKMLDLLFSNEGQYDSYEDFYKKFVNAEGLESINRNTKRHRTSVRAIYAFDEYGRYPSRVIQGTPIGRKTAYMKLTPAYKLIIDNYKLCASKTFKKVNTIDAEAYSASKFFLAMLNQGASDLSLITPTMIQAFFFDDQHVLRRSSHKWNIAVVLKSNKSFETWNECKRVLYLLPPIKRAKKNYPYLTKEEVSLLIDSLDDLTDVSLRDKAIIKLFYYTGIRGIDVSKMKLNSIDWRTDKISLTQSKTGEPLTLPLRATVGNAIFDYIKKERPNNKSGDILFTNMHIPEKGLHTSSFSTIVRKVFDKLGIRKDKTERGFRLFRHNLATKLLENGVQTRVISDILGHVSSLSLNPYIDADITHLRECGLSIEKFPIRKEVFDL